jgi:type IV pilus assembly protein PilQ
MSGCSSFNKSAGSDSAFNNELESNSDLALEGDSGANASSSMESANNLGGDSQGADTAMQTSAPASTAEPVMSSATGDVVVNDLKYQSQQGGSIVISTSGPATFQTREVSAQNQMIVEISNAHLPDRLKRPFITKDFRQSIASFNAYQDRGSTTARVVIQLRDSVKAQVRQSGNSLVVVPTGATAGMGAEAGEADGDMLAATEGAQRSDSRILPTSSLDKDNAEEVRFYGKPISIEVRDTPVREVINLIAEQSGANILIASEVDGNVSMKLRQIPWDQALLLVMKSRNLGYVRQGSVLRVAPLPALQKEMDDARKVIDAQQAAEPLKVRVIPVSFADVTALAGQLKDFVSTRGKVVADVRTSSIVVTEIDETLQRIANLVKALDLPPLQVLVEGKVVEARETFGRDFGVNWSSRGQDVSLGSANLGTNLTVTAPASSKAMEVGVRLGTVDILGDLTAALSLYERENIVRIVSSPRIVMMNNEQGTIVQSSNIPITQTQTSSAGNLTSVTYKPIELRLEVTPQITADSDVIMKLNIKREFAGDRSNATPDINSREAKTKVLVHNGQTAVIGGIYQSDSQENETGVPWLKEIPILGWLFKNKNRTSEKTELLLFLTPRILNSEQALPKESSL